MLERTVANAIPVARAPLPLSGGSGRGACWRMLLVSRPSVPTPSRGFPPSPPAYLITLQAWPPSCRRTCTT